MQSRSTYRNASEACWFLRCIYIVTSVSFAGMLALVMAAAVDMALMPRSRFHTWRSLLLTYLVRRYFRLVGWYKWRQVSANYSDFHGAQERFVLETLKRNAESEYGRQHRFSEIHSLKVCMFATVIWWQLAHLRYARLSYQDYL